MTACMYACMSMKTKIDAYGLIMLGTTATISAIVPITVFVQCVVCTFTIALALMKLRPGNSFFIAPSLCARTLKPRPAAIRP